MELTHGWPVGNSRAFFVRDCYAALEQKLRGLLGLPPPDRAAASRSEEEAPEDRAPGNAAAVVGQRVVLTGTPGTGKSMFGAYFLLRMLQNPPREVDIVVDLPYAVGFISKGRFVPALLSSASVMEKLNEWRNLYVYDARCGAQPMDQTLLKCHCLLIAGPNGAHFKQFTDPLPVTLYMPLWTLEELQQLRASCYPGVTAASVDSQFVQWGGSARFTVVHD